MSFQTGSQAQEARQAQEAMEKRIVEFQKKRAATGEAQACFDLGLRHATGNGVPQDVAEAKRLLQLSVENANTQTLKTRAKAELAKLGQGGQ